jgi:hypothetical protein
MQRPLDLHKLATPIKGDPLHVQLMREVIGTYLVIDWEDGHSSEAARFETVVMDIAIFLNWRLDNR